MRYKQIRERYRKVRDGRFRGDTGYRYRNTENGAMSSGENAKNSKLESMEDILTEEICGPEIFFF
jgi:hypothetical protein